MVRHLELYMELEVSIKWGHLPYRNFTSYSSKCENEWGSLDSCICSIATWAPFVVGVLEKQTHISFWTWASSSSPSSWVPISPCHHFPHLVWRVWYELGFLISRFSKLLIEWDEWGLLYYSHCSAYGPMLHLVKSHSTPIPTTLFCQLLMSHSHGYKIQKGYHPKRNFLAVHVLSFTAYCSYDSIFSYV